MKSSDAEIIAAAAYEDNPQIQAALLGNLSSLHADPQLFDAHMQALTDITEELNDDAKACKGLASDMKLIGLFDAGDNTDQLAVSSIEASSSFVGPSI